MTLRKIISVERERHTDVLTLECGHVEKRMKKTRWGKYAQCATCSTIADMVAPVIGPGKLMVVDDGGATHRQRVAEGERMVQDAHHRKVRNMGAILHAIDADASLAAFRAERFHDRIVKALCDLMHPEQADRVVAALNRAGLAIVTVTDKPGDVTVTYDRPEPHVFDYVPASAIVHVPAIHRWAEFKVPPGGADNYDFIARELANAIVNPLHDDVRQRIFLALTRDP